MAEYGGLQVPARSYSRFSCKSYKVVRDEGGRGGINIVKSLELMGYLDVCYLITC